MFEKCTQIVLSCFMKTLFQVGTQSLQHRREMATLSFTYASRYLHAKSLKGQAVGEESQYPVQEANTECLQSGGLCKERHVFQK